jgi:hypothetical protein
MYHAEMALPDEVSPSSATGTLFAVFPMQLHVMNIETDLDFDQGLQLSLLLKVHLAVSVSSM